MKALIVYHSETGNTRRVAEFLHEKIDSDIVELRPDKPYSKLGMYSSGLKQAVMHQSTEIRVASIDASPYDLIVVGSPVWGGQPTPVVNAGIDTFGGIEGKKVIMFVTYRKSEGKSLDTLTEKLGGLGANVKGVFGFSEKETADPGKLEPVIDAAIS